MFDHEEDDYEGSEVDLEENGCSEEEEGSEEQLNSEQNQNSEDGEECDYAEEIRGVIAKYNDNPLELSTFSTGGEIEGAMGVPAVHVDGVGRLAYHYVRSRQSHF